MRILALAAASLGLSCMLLGCDYEDLLHHRPDHTGGPPGQTDNGNSQEPTTCTADHHCEEGEGCTQGGQCIDITGTSSVLMMLQEEIDELPNSVGMGVSYQLPSNAVLRFDDDKGNGLGLEIGNGVMLEGNGARLLVANGMVGIRLTNGASWSTIRDLRIDPQSPGTAHDGIGIDVRAHGVRLKNLMISRMGTGIRAHTQANDLPQANVNTQQWSRIILRNNFTYGMHVRSGDANSGLFQGIEVLGGGGIQDDSFLGNTYIAPVIETESPNTFHSTGQAGATTVLGLYLEEGTVDPTSNALRDLFLGGNAIPRVTSPGDRIGGHHSRVHFGIRNGVSMRIPAGPHEPFGFRHPAESNEWRMRYTQAWQQWGFTFIATGAMPYQWTGMHHPSGPGKYILGEPAQ